MPLGGTKVDVSLGLENFDEDQRLSRGNVLDLMDIQGQIEIREGRENAYVVTISIREHCRVTGLKVESPRGGTASKRGGPSMSGNNIKPF